MKKNCRVNVSRFFGQAQRHLKFEGIDQVMSDDELQAKLTAAEENYYLQGPEFTTDDIADIEPLNYFEIKDSESDSIDIIKRLNKVDSFYKRYAKELAPALSLILMVMNRSHLFPSVCKITNLTFLPNRTIFSLDFLAKFVERAVQDAVDEVTPPEEYGQFAYQKDRSCELLVAIGLDRAERCEEPCIGVGMDARKAFDTAPWVTMGRNMQKTCNGGRFWYNYTKNRTYKFRGKLGFQDKPMGRGAPPGTILAPNQFATFQTTDIEMTMKGALEAWLWSGLFSDDKNPIASMAAVRSGKVQAALDSTVG